VRTAMNKTLLSLCVVSTLTTGSVWAAGETALNATVETYMITGLHCPACTKTIEASLSKTPGIQSIKVDWKTKDAKIAFDESKVSAQQVAQLIAATPHMMGPSMNYDGWLVLKTPDMKDDATAKAKDALQKVAGVKSVNTFPDKHLVEIQFTADGKTNSQQLVDALSAVGLKAENF
jgi:copper chaperone CopZ